MRTAYNDITLPILRSRWGRTPDRALERLTDEIRALDPETGNELASALDDAVRKVLRDWIQEGLEDAGTASVTPT